MEWILESMVAEMLVPPIHLEYLEKNRHHCFNHCYIKELDSSKTFLRALESGQSVDELFDLKIPLGICALFQKLVKYPDALHRN